MLLLLLLLFNSRTELKRVTEICTRMFHEPHGKVFSMFLDVLVTLVMTHCTDLDDWLYVLITRLITKTGVDLLGSVQAKIARAIETIRYVHCTHTAHLLTCTFFSSVVHTSFFSPHYSLTDYIHYTILVVMLLKLLC